ncbi:MAG: hypothetical protein DRO39_09065 [Thermoprotei archaeon]|nr:MAG: hypothetical protein DRO39_09065 [Thermoprotei archaeon]
MPEAPHWYEFRVVGKEARRYWAPKGGRECLVAEIELYLRDGGLEVRLTDPLGRPLTIRAELWCRERGEPGATHGVSER